MIVVADTTPIHYLIIIDEVEVLPRLYGRIVIPRTVNNELIHSRAPVRVQEWMKQPPDWAGDSFSFCCT